MSSGDLLLIKSIQEVMRKDKGFHHLADEENAEFEEKFTKLSDFTTEYVLESAARLVNLIANDTYGYEILKRVKPPPSISARYNMGATLAEAISNMGYRVSEEIGYQTFLYGTEKDLRNIFMFLLDKLPKEKEIVVEQISGPLETLKSRIRSKLNEQMVLPWAPPECFPSGLRPIRGESFVRQGTRGCEDFCACDLCFAGCERQLTLPKETKNAIFNLPFSGLETPSRLCSSLISYNETLGISADSFGLLSNLSEKLQLDGTLSNDKSIYNEADVLHLQTSLKESEQETALVKSETPNIENLLTDLKSKRVAVEDKYTNLQIEYKTVRNETISLRKDVAQNKSKKSELDQKALELKSSKQKWDQILTLLPEAEMNVEKLKEMIAKREEKLLSWKQEFEKHQKILDEQHHQHVQQLHDHQADHEEGAEASLSSKILACERAIADKESLIEKFSTQLNKTKESDLRSTYTRQILDILSQISRQRQESLKLLDDIRGTQKDINLLDGKLHRTYIEADNKVFQMAKDDSNVVPVYRSLTDIHKESSGVIEIIRQTGQIKRSNRAIQDQITLEQAKNNKDRVAQLKRDLVKVRAENKAMKEKIKSNSGS